MSSGTSRVIVVSLGKDHLVQDLTRDTRLLRTMVEQGLCELIGASEPKSAWMHFFTPSDTIGLKVNCLGGPSMCTHPALVEAVAQSLSTHIVTPKQIYIWDRCARELNRCGYSLNWKDPSRFQCAATDIKGVDYERELSIFGSVGSRLSRIITTFVSAQINMPILKDHGLCGLTGALKNMFGAIHNPNK